jgi:hypothetical protein
MLDRLLRRTQSPVLVRLEVVELFNELIQQRAEIQTKESTLTAGLTRAEDRLAAIPALLQNIHDDHYRNVVQRELDLTKPDQTEYHNEKLASLTAEQVDLQGKISAYGRELETVRIALQKLNGQYGAVEHARRAMWAAIADELVKQVSPDFAPQFSRIWTAMDRSRDHCYFTDVLARLAPTELTNEVRMTTIDALSQEYGFTNE